MADARNKILIVDDHEAIRSGFAEVLGRIDDFDVLPPASNGLEALDRNENFSPDIVLLDIRMPDMDGIEVARRLNTRPGGRPGIIHLTMYSDTDIIFRAMENGVEGFLLKDVESPKLVSSIDVVLNGGVVFDQSVANVLLSKPVHDNGRQSTTTQDAGDLTQRETQVACLIAAGHSNRSIADELGLSEGTVRNHVSAILAKFDVSSRTQLVLETINRGIVTS